MKSAIELPLSFVLLVTFSGYSTFADERLKSIHDQLLSISAKAAKHEKLFQRIRVDGTINAEPFSLTIVDSKCRYEREVGTSSGKLKSYALDDGEAYFTSSGDDLVLDSASGTRENLSKRVARPFWGFLQPPYEYGELCSVSEYCSRLAQLTQDEDAFGPDGPLSISLTEQGGLIELNLAVSFARPPKIRRTKVKSVHLTFDRDRGCLMTRYQEHEHSPLGAEVSSTEKLIVVKTQEIAPNVFFPLSGELSLVRSGSDMEARGEAISAIDRLQVTSVEFGDLSLPEGFFDVHQWPGVNKGMDVHDARFDPPLDFIYDEGPFEEVVLNGIAKREVSNNRTREWGRLLVIFLNVGLLSTALVIWFFKRQSV